MTAVDQEDQVRPAVGPGRAEVLARRALASARRSWALLAVAGLAVVVRLLVVTWYLPPCASPGPVAGGAGSASCFAPAGDALYYEVQAFHLARGEGFLGLSLTPSAQHPPLFPLWLGALQRLGLESAQSHRVVGALLGGLAVLLVGLLGRRLGGTRPATADPVADPAADPTADPTADTDADPGGVGAHDRVPVGRRATAVGVVAGLFVACYPGFLVADANGRAEVLFLPATAWGLLAATRMWDRRRPIDAAVLGLAGGVMWLTRPEAVLYPWLLALLLLVRFGDVAWRRRLGLAALVVVVPVALMAPWILHNRARFDGRWFVTTTAGQTLVMNACDASFYGPYPAYQSYICLTGPVPPPDRPPTPGAEEAAEDVSYRLAAVQYLRENAGDVPLVAWIKVRRIWNVFSPAETIELDSRLEGYGQGGAKGTLGMFAALVPFVAVGLWSLVRRRQPVAPLVATFVVVTVTAVLAGPLTRFRLPADLALCVLAAEGAVIAAGAVWRWWRGTQATASAAVAGSSAAHPPAAPTERPTATGPAAPRSATASTVEGDRTEPSARGSATAGPGGAHPIGWVRVGGVAGTADGPRRQIRPAIGTTWARVLPAALLVVLACVGCGVPTKDGYRFDPAQPGRTTTSVVPNLDPAACPVVDAFLTAVVTLGFPPPDAGGTDELAQRVIATADAAVRLVPQLEVPIDTIAAEAARRAGRAELAVRAPAVAMSVADAMGNLDYYRAVVCRVAPPR